MAVVGLHTFPKDLSVVTASLCYLCGFAVPFFFMSSGYFLLNRGALNYKYAGHKCVGIIKIVFFWNCILYVIKLGKALALDKMLSMNLFCICERVFKVFCAKGNNVAILVSWSIIDYLHATSILIKIESAIQKSSIIDLWNYIDCISNCIFLVRKANAKVCDTDVSYMDMVVLFSVGCRNENIKRLDFQSYMRSISFPIMYGDQPWKVKYKLARNSIFLFRVKRVTLM